MSNNIKLRPARPFFSESLLKEYKETKQDFDNKQWIIKDYKNDRVHVIDFGELKPEHADIVKSYTLKCLERCMSIGHLLNLIRLIISIYKKYGDFENVEIDKILGINKTTGSDIYYLNNYIKFAGINNPYISTAVSSISNRYKNIRTIPSIQSLLRLDAVIDDFFCNGDKQLQILYYPVYLWWTLGGAFPMRPIEFTYIKRDCLHFDGKYWSFSIPTAKELLSDEIQYDEFGISEELAKIIESYLDLTNDFDSDSEYLFSEKAFEILFKRVVRMDGTKRSIVNVDDFRKVFDSFLEEIVINQYNYVIVGKQDQVIELDSFAMEKVDLGDLRHFAMYNMVRAGLDPYSIMKFARHKSINTQTHYYGHVYNMSLGSIQIISDQLCYALFNRRYENMGPVNSAFDKHRINILNIEKERNPELKLTPVRGGGCLVGLNCQEAFDCPACSSFIPNTDKDSINYLQYEYDKEMGHLEDICNCIKMLFLERSEQKDEYKKLSIQRESSLYRAGCIKSKIKYCEVKKWEDQENTMKNS